MAACFGFVGKLKVDQAVGGRVKRATRPTDNGPFDGLPTNVYFRALGDAIPTFEDEHRFAGNALLCTDGVADGGKVQVVAGPNVVPDVVKHRDSACHRSDVGGERAERRVVGSLAHVTFRIQVIL